MDILGILAILSFAVFLLFIIKECVQALKQLWREERCTKSSKVLFNASVTENGVSPEEVFDTLYKAGIKPNYLNDKNS